MKNKYKGLDVFGALLGMRLSRSLGNSNYFGINGNIIVGLFCLSIIVPFIIMMIIKKFYLVSFLITILLIPMVVGFVGLYYKNINLVLGGIIVFFIILSIYLIFMRRHNKNKDTINYDRYRNY